MTEFLFIYAHNILRVASGVSRLEVADAQANLSDTMRFALEGERHGAGIMLFPELGLSAYAIDNLVASRRTVRLSVSLVTEMASLSARLCPGRPTRARPSR